MTLITVLLLAPNVEVNRKPPLLKAFRPIHTFHGLGHVHLRELQSCALTQKRPILYPKQSFGKKPGLMHRRELETRSSSNYFFNYVFGLRSIKREFYKPIKKNGCQYFAYYNSFSPFQVILII